LAVNATNSELAQEREIRDITNIRHQAFVRQNASANE